MVALGSSTFGTGSVAAFLPRVARLSSSGTAALAAAEAARPRRAGDSDLAAGLDGPDVALERGAEGIRQRVSRTAGADLLMRDGVVGSAEAPLRELSKEDVKKKD